MKPDFGTFIFDFDLTLADSSKGILICFRETLRHFGYPVPDDRTIFGTIGKTVPDSLDILTGIPNNPQREEMRRFYVRTADTYMVANTEFYPETAAVLAALKAAHCRTAVVSTKFRYRIEESFREKLPQETVELLIGGEDVSHHKPAPDGLLLALETLHADLQTALYVGDSYIDAQTAMAAGVAFGAVLTGSTTREEFLRYPCVGIGENLGELMGQFIAL